MKIKKITAIAGSVLMAGLTIASAAAAAFPAPFVDNGKADVAIVYGAAADSVAATNVHTALGTFAVSEGATTVTGGESFKLSKNSNNFNFNDALNDVYTSLSSTNMPFLEDGTYNDGSIDETFTQKITLGTRALKLQRASDLNDGTPTLGFKFSSSDKVLDYTIDYDTAINISLMASTDMPILGKDYYVLSASTTKIELLDTSEKSIIAEGETMTINGKSVSIEYIGSTKVMLNIDGETTNNLLVNTQYKLKDGSYVIVTKNLYDSKDSGTSKAEIALGSGKITLNDGATAKLNSDSIKGLTSTFTVSGNTLDKLKLTWKPSDTTYLTKDNVMTMPGFGVLSLSYDGLDFSTPETVSLNYGEQITLDMDNYNLPILWYNAGSPELGEEFHKLVVTPVNLTYFQAGYSAVNESGGWVVNLSDGSQSIVNTTEILANNATFVTNVIPVKKDERFLATRIKKDISDAQTFYYEATTVGIETDSSLNDVILTDKIGSNDINLKRFDDYQDRGDATFTLKGENFAKDTAYISVTAGADTVTFNKVVSDKGLVITLPTAAEVSAIDAFTNATFVFQEANKDGDLNGLGTPTGSTFSADVMEDTTNNRLYVSAAPGVTLKDKATNDKYGYVASDLASKISFTTPAGNTNEYSIDYYGQEISADVSVAVGGTVTTGAAADFLPVMASEIENVKSKNLVIVGGSCINSAAATVLGGAYCGDAFTAATGVATNEFLIKGVEGAFTDGKLALVVAGYEAADTAMAVTYLTKKDVDTSSDAVYTSATDVTLVQKKA